MMSSMITLISVIPLGHDVRFNLISWLEVGDWRFHSDLTDTIVLPLRLGTSMTQGTNSKYSL